MKCRSSLQFTVADSFFCKILLVPTVEMNAASAKAEPETVLGHVCGTTLNKTAICYNMVAKHGDDGLKCDICEKSKESVTHVLNEMDLKQLPFILRYGSVDVQTCTHNGRQACLVT